MCHGFNLTKSNGQPGHIDTADQCFSTRGSQSIFRSQELLFGLPKPLILWYKNELWVATLLIILFCGLRWEPMIYMLRACQPKQLYHFLIVKTFLAHCFRNFKWMRAWVNFLAWKYTADIVLCSETRRLEGENKRQKLCYFLNNENFRVSNGALKNHW
jgi:hypothetical protein